MNELKEGDLVKVWDDLDPSNYIVGKFYTVTPIGYYLEGVDEPWNRAKLIPKGLEEQLERLGGSM